MPAEVVLKQDGRPVCVEFGPDIEQTEYHMVEGCMFVGTQGRSPRVGRFSRVSFFSLSGADAAFVLQHVAVTRTEHNFDEGFCTHG